METIICDARHAGRKVYVTGMDDEVRSVLTGLNADHCLPADTHFAKRIDALRSAVSHWLETKGEKLGSSDDALPAGAK